jgi:branched-chain amino acid transport system permease protein
VFWVQLTIAGIATGCIYALAGMGLVLTYKATGIFNFAHGAIAMLVAYVLWEAKVQWHWPLWLAAFFALFIVGPGIGIMLERLVFRPLARRGATTAEKLVATVGVFIICFGLAFQVWTGKVRQGPRLITNRGLHLAHGLILGVDYLVFILLVVAVGGGMAILFRYTHLGTEIRAVVDRRELAELSAVNANRVASFSWAMGCGLAGLTGVLLAPDGLDPFHLTLLVIESFSIAVVAGLTSLPVTVAAGVLILGVGSALLAHVSPHVVPLLHTHLPSALRTTIDQLRPNLSVFVLFLALIVLRNLDEPADAQPGQAGLVSRAIGAATRRRRGSLALGAVAAVAAIVLPFTLSTVDLPRGQVMLAYIVVFTSIVCITGFCGYITLGQAGFAGFGAYVTGKFIQSGHLPVILAMVLGGLGAMVLGLVAGYPALKRRGLFLGLTTLSIGLLASGFVFSSDLLKARGLLLNRPSWFSGDRAFYFFELGWVVLMLLLARNLRSGRLGRILAAMRDSEVATQSIGIDLRSYKLFIFAASAFIAGIGGALLSEQTRVFSGGSFDTITSLLWFTVVIVAGVGNLSGAVLGGVIYVLLDVVLHTRSASGLAIASGALLLGYLPGRSLIGLWQRLLDIASSPRRLGQVWHAQVAKRPVGAGLTAVAGSGPASNGLSPSPFAERLLDEAGHR